MPEEKIAGEEPAWKYEHPKDHPDNKPPMTIVATPSEEATKAYEDSVNAELAKTQPAEAPVQQAQGAPHAAAAKVNYNEKTVHELKELAAERGVEIGYDARKDEIIKALEKQDKKDAKA